MYEIPEEGLHEAKRHKREEDEDVSVNGRQLRTAAKHASMTDADTMENSKTGREAAVRVWDLKKPYRFFDLLVCYVRIE